MFLPFRIQYKYRFSIPTLSRIESFLVHIFILCSLYFIQDKNCQSSCGFNIYSIHEHPWYEGMGVMVPIRIWVWLSEHFQTWAFLYKQIELLVTR